MHCIQKCAFYVRWRCDLVGDLDARRTKRILRAFMLVKRAFYARLSQLSSTCISSCMKGKSV